MNTCLNPDTPHVAQGTTLAQTMCPEPVCGFLLGGAIVNRWQVISLLRRGPISDLYMATRVDGANRDHPTMLLKVMRSPIAGHPAQWPDKIEHILALQHPHIHPVVSAGWLNPGEWLYFVSMYEEQGSLARMTNAMTQLPPLAVASIVRQIAEALAYAHQLLQVHGRLKLENCLVVAPATVQVSDFYYGLLGPEAQVTDVPFMADEQWRGQIEAASDQYALALLTYQLLVGNTPLLRAGFRPTQPPQSPSLPQLVSEVRPELPRQVDQALGQALSRQPYERFPNVLAFAVALQQALEAPLSGASWPMGHSPVPASVVSNPRYSNPSVTQGTPPYLAVPQPLLPGALIPACSLPGHTSAPTILRWASDGSRLASVGGDQSIQLSVIQRQVGAPLATLTGHTGEVLALNWSPDGSAIASGGADGAVRTWSTSDSSAKAAWWGHEGSVAAIDWSPNGMRIATGGADRTIRLWDRQGNALASWQASGRGVTALAWSPDGRVLAAGGADQIITLWDPESGTVIASLEGHNDEIRHVSWSPDGGLLASYAGKKDQRACLWDRQKLRLIAVLGNHTREIVGLHWSDDGSWLATAAGDAQLRYWDAQQRLGELLKSPIALPATPVCMAGAPRSSLLAFGQSNFLIQVMKIELRN